MRRIGTALCSPVLYSPVLYSPVLYSPVLCLLGVGLLAAACSSPRERHVPQPTAGGEARAESEPAGVTPTETDPREAEPTESEPPSDPVAEPEPPPPARAPMVARVSAQDVTVDARRPPADFLVTIGEAIRAPLDEVLTCYRERLAHDPTLEGDLRLRLWVSARRVIRATPEQDLADAALQVCAITRIRTLALPPSAPSAGASVRFLVRFARGPRTVAPPPGVMVAEAEGTVP